MGRHSILIYVAGMALLLVSGSSAPASKCHNDSGCIAVQEKMLACSDYLTGNRSDVPTRCCDHLENLNDLVGMCLSPRSICYCVEELAHKLSSRFRSDRVHSLSRRCRNIKHISFPISNDMDCSKVRKRSHNC